MGLGWGMVGLGSVATRVAQAISIVDGCALAAVCSRDPGKAAAFGQRFAATSSYANYEDILGDSAVDAVYIATPNGLHASQAILALEAGKHVLVEKPMALTVEDARRMVEVAHHHGRRLGVGFHLRYHPVHQEMRRSVSAGEVGEVVFAQALWGSYSPDFWQSARDRWQMNASLAGGGSIMGLGVHLIDLLRWIVGQEIIEVAAFTDGPNDQFPVEFLTAALLRFENGALAEFTSSRRLPNGANGVSVYGTEGRLDGQATLSMDARGQYGITRGPATTITQLPLHDLYAQEIDAFCRAVQNGAEVGATGEDGVRSVAVTVAVLESARTGRAVSAI